MVLASALLALGGSSLVAATALAKTQQINEHVALTLVKRTGSTNFQHKGRATGTVSGTVRSTITLTHAVVLNGTVTITTSAGQLRLKVSGRARSLAIRSAFNGSATIAGGTGRYAHAHGKGGFTGIVNRNTWAATLDATGSLTY